MILLIEKERCIVSEKNRKTNLSFEICIFYI